MMFSEQPTVPQIEFMSRDWIITRTRAAVPAEFRMMMKTMDYTPISSLPRLT